MPTPTPHRITDAQRRENKRELRDLRRQLAALRVEGRVIDARNRAKWEAEKERAAVALKWARALPEAKRRSYYLTGRWPGEQWRRFCRFISEALDQCIVASRVATPSTTPKKAPTVGGANRVTTFYYFLRTTL